MPVDSHPSSPTYATGMDSRPKPTKSTPILWTLNDLERGTDSATQFSL